MRDISQAVASECYIWSADAPRENPWVKCKKHVFCTYETSSICHTNDFDDPRTDAEEAEERTEDDLWLSRLAPDFN